MPNNLVFNDIASSLKVQLYGLSGTDVKPILTDTSGNLAITGTVSVSGGTIDVLTAGTVTVSGGTIDVLTSGTVQTMPLFESAASLTLAVTSATMDVFVKDTSTKKVYSFYVAYVTGTSTLTALLQIAPTNAASYYVNDSSTQYTLTNTTQRAVLVAAKFLQWTKLQLVSASDTVTVNCYYNAQS